MADVDYVVLGAGTSGCVIANRLSEGGHHRVLLVEAGGAARSPYLHVPRVGGRVFHDPRYSWSYHTVPFGPLGTSEAWPRGRVLGGSSAINGMVYNRGHRDDYDDLVRLGNSGWGWDDILPIYRRIENHQFGPSATRGAGGPVPVSVPEYANPLAAAIISASQQLGMRAVADVNDTAGPRVGLPPATIHRGRRVSAAGAFLRPALSRPNLTVATHAYAERLVLEHGRAVGVVLRTPRSRETVRVRREVIVCLGALESPKLLQLSGIGPRDVLRAAGVTHYLDRSQVGMRMRDHRTLVTTYRLKGPLGYNHQLSTPLAKFKTGVHYLATRKGPLATPTADVLALFASDPTSPRVDGQMLATALTVANGNGAQRSTVEHVAGITCMGEILRPTSEGSVRVTSPDPQGALLIDPNYFATEYDRQTGARVLRTMRSIFQRSPIAEFVDFEITPGADVTSDADLVDAALVYGANGHHAMGTCAMGPDDQDVVDDQLRVRGIDGLRIADLSVWPIMLSGNTNGPAMAMAWRAADLILDAVATRPRSTAS